MTLELHQNKILELMKELELLMATIYQRLAHFYPEHAAEYQSLVAEEMEHAGWIEQLQTACQADKARFAEGKTRTYTVSGMISYIQEFQKKLETGLLSELQAMTAVTDFENALIERTIFQRFTGDSLEVEKVLGLLEATQKKHIGRIGTLLQTIRSSSKA